MGNFNELAAVLAKGMNFKENSVILAAGIANEDDTIDTLVHLDGDCLLLLEQIIKAMIVPLTGKEIDEFMRRMINICDRLWSENYER